MINPRIHACIHVSIVYACINISRNPTNAPFSERRIGMYGHLVVGLKDLALEPGLLNVSLGASGGAHGTA